MKNQFKKVADKEAPIESLVGMYLNRQGYSDTNPVGKVIGVTGKSTLIVQQVTTTTDSPINKNDLKWEAGGFAGCCVNSYNQKWEFKFTETIIKIRVSKGERYIYAATEPHKYYDFNF